MAQATPRLRQLESHLRGSCGAQDPTVPTDVAAETVAADRRTPYDYAAADWAQLESERRPIFDEAALATALGDAGGGRAKFLADGVLLLDRVMTEHGRRSWTAALQAGQRARDRMIREDWRETIDWKALHRRTRPAARPTAEQIAYAEGCTQEPPGDESCGTTTLKNHGLFIDHFSAGHLPFLMDVMTHPQMLGLQKKLLGTEHVLLDHNSLLNRKGGYAGGGW